MGLSIPKAIQAGLCEGSRMGTGINPVLGSGVRISKVVTDWEVGFDKPIFKFFQVVPAEEVLAGVPASCAGFTDIPEQVDQIGVTANQLQLLDLCICKQAGEDFLQFLMAWEKRRWHYHFFVVDRAQADLHLSHGFRTEDRADQRAIIGQAVGD